MIPQLKLHVVPASHGMVWLRQGIRTLMHRPMAFSALFACVVFGFVALFNVPIAGPLLWIACLPMISLGFMVATQQALQGATPMPSAFVLPLRVTRGRTRSLLALCVMYLVAAVGIGLFCHWMDEGKVAELMVMFAKVQAKEATEAQLAELLANPLVRNGVVWRLGLSCLLMLVFWFAPPLVHWGGHSAGKALFFSVVAVWRNKLVFIVYIGGWMALFMVLGLVQSVGVALFGIAAAVVIGPAAMLMMFTVIYTSLFFTFIDAFEVSMPTPPADAPQP